MTRRLVLLLLALSLGQPVRAGWQPVGQGDCPGPQLFGSAGKEPDNARCTPELAGKTALCFTGVCNPGCQYIDVPTRQCQDGTESADVYTCVPDPRP